MTTTRNAAQTARSAERTRTNEPGMCLRWCRERANIPPLHPDAATAWKHAFHRHRDRRAPRGAMVYWLGGSRGHGHIAVSLGHGRIRSTDAGGRGIVATVPLEWVEQNWGLPYAGWADNVNGYQIPGVVPTKDEDEMNDNDWKKLRRIVAEEVAKTPDAVWDRRLDVYKADGRTPTKKRAGQMLREVLQAVRR